MAEGKQGKGDYGLAVTARCDGLSAHRETRQVEATVMGREMGRVGAGSKCKYRRSGEAAVVKQEGSFPHRGPQ